MFDTFTVKVINKATGEKVAEVHRVEEIDLTSTMNYLRNENPGCRVYYS